MKLKKFIPTFRNVIFHEVRPEKTEKGIYIPSKDFVLTTHADMFDNEKEHRTGKLGEYVVLKAGADCTYIKPGDKIMLEVNSPALPLRFDDIDHEVYQVREQQIAGYERD